MVPLLGIQLPVERSEDPDAHSSRTRCTHDAQDRCYGTDSDRKRGGPQRAELRPTCAAVLRAGGIPLILCAVGPGLAGQVVETVDGLLLTGGDDMDPSHYGGRLLILRSIRSSWQRDAFELAMFRAARTGRCRRSRSAAASNW